MKSQPIKAFTVPATLDGASTLKDGGVSIRFHTQELPKKDKEALFEYVNTFGWLMFALKALEEKDIPKDPPKVEPGDLSPSQKLRQAIWVLWDKRDRPGDQDAFYATQMERLRQAILKKADEVK